MSKGSFSWALAIALGLSACGDKGKDSGSAAKDSAGTSSQSTTTAGSTSKPAQSAAAADKKEKTIDVNDILKSDDPAASGVLKVDLSKVDDGAPALGGTKKVAEPTAGGELKWSDIGPVQIPVPPGWELQGPEDGFAFLESGEKPEAKAGVVFTDFTTTEDGAAKVDSMTQRLGLTETQWQKATPVKLGDDSSMPALLSIGTAKDNKGKPVKLFFALIKTGQPTNLLALGGADGDAPEDHFDLAVGVVASMKAAPGDPTPSDGDESLVKQCNKVIEQINAVDMSAASNPTADNLSKLADGLEANAKAIDAIQVPDKKLAELKASYAANLRANAKAYRAMATAMNKGDTPKTEELAKAAKESGEIVDAINKHCGGK